MPLGFLTFLSAEKEGFEGLGAVFSNYFQGKKGLERSNSGTVGLGKCGILSNALKWHSKPLTQRNNVTFCPCTGSDLSRFPHISLSDIQLHCLHLSGLYVPQSRTSHLCRGSSGVYSINLDSVGSAGRGGMGRTGLGLPSLPSFGGNLGIAAGGR